MLDFKNRRRTVMTPGQYTELFFLDEATALAAGHRPCAECQRERFTAYRAFWAAANPDLAGSSTPTVGVIDAVLHGERLAKEQRPRLLPSEFEQLPNGAFVAPVGEDHAYLVLRGRLLRWSPFGYEQVNEGLPVMAMRLLTPLSIVRTLNAGYEAGLHLSAVVSLE